MHQRMPLGAATLICFVLMACAERDDPGPNPPDNGCTGVCNQGDGGTQYPDGGRVCPMPNSQGRGPIGELRINGTPGQQVRLEHLIVTAVDNTNQGGQGDYIAHFWVVDPCFPSEGLYVDKFYTDPPGPYLPRVGDAVTVQGLFRRYKATATDAHNTRNAYRPVVKNDFQLDVPGVTGNLTLTQAGTAPVPADITVAAGFGNANGGQTQANSEYAGARVHIPGPLTVTNPRPPALKQRPGEPQHGTYLGFEVSGGVLVNNYKTFGETPTDGGATRCDWGARAGDGGLVTFPNGIRGVWDTYSYVPCSGTNCANRDAGYVPGSDNPYIYVLYPQNCETDLPGVFDGGTP